MRPTSLPAAARYDLDLTCLEDEHLVVMAQECGSGSARDELIHRYLPLSGELVGRYAARARLQEADRQDVQQDAVLWIMEAIARYRTGEFVRSGGCHFRSFLQRVLAARFIDSLRHRRHLRAHFPLIEADTLNRSEDSDCRRHRGATGGGAGPLGEVEGRELGDCLDREVGRFAEPDRRLWDLVAAGAPLRQAAAAVGVSYERVKRRWRELVAHLRFSLGGPRAVGLAQRGGLGPPPPSGAHPATPPRPVPADDGLSFFSPPRIPPSNE